MPLLQLYGNYSITNRAPTPLELSCASAATPCSLLNFFVGDPNLNQVVAHTYEVGLRGHTDERMRGQWSWGLDFYHTQNTNDIIYETTAYNPNLAFYTNAGRTLRRGAEANLRLFAIVNNVCDKRYYTYGSFAPVSAVPWPNLPRGVTDPRTASPGTPITA